MGKVKLCQHQNWVPIWEGQDLSEQIGRECTDCGIAFFQTIDENDEIAPDLDDEKFVKSREAILRLLPKLFPDGSSRFSDSDVMERLVDETVEEIARVWDN